MKNIDSLFITLCISFSSILISYSILHILEAYKNKNKQNFKLGLFWFITSLSPITIIIVPVILIMLLIHGINFMFNNFINKLLK